MLRGIGRVLQRGLRCDGRQGYKTSVRTTHLFCSGVSGWREHGREDSQFRAICTLPAQVGVAVGCDLFCRCQQVVLVTVALVTHLACLCGGLFGGNLASGNLKIETTIRENCATQHSQYALPSLRSCRLGKQSYATISLVCTSCCAQPEVGLCVVRILISEHHGGHFVDQAVQRVATALR